MFLIVRNYEGCRDELSETQSVSRSAVAAKGFDGTGSRLFDAVREIKDWRMLEPAVKSPSPSSTASAGTAGSPTFGRSGPFGTRGRSAGCTHLRTCLG